MHFAGNYFTTNDYLGIHADLEGIKIPHYLACAQSYSDTVIAYLNSRLKSANDGIQRTIKFVNRYVDSCAYIPRASCLTIDVIASRDVQCERDMARGT